MEQNTSGLLWQRILLTLCFAWGVIWTATMVCICVPIAAVLLLPVWAWEGRSEYQSIYERQSGRIINFCARMLLFGCSWGWKVHLLSVESWKQIGSVDSTTIKENTPEQTRQRRVTKEAVVSKPARSTPFRLFDFTNGGTTQRSCSVELLMANHLTNSDPFVLRGLLFPWPSKFLYKSDLRKIPFLGWCMMAAGDIPVWFTSAKGGWGTVKGTVSTMMERSFEVMRRQCPVFVFPEGARAGTGPQLPLRPGYFRLAAEHNLRIKPIAIFGTQFAWPPGSLLLDLADVYVVVPDDHVESEGRPKESLVEALQADIRTAFHNLQSHCPGYEAKAPLELEQLEKKIADGDHVPKGLF